MSTPTTTPTPTTTTPLPNHPTSASPPAQQQQSQLSLSLSGQYPPLSRLPPSHPKYATIDEGYARILFETGVLRKKQQQERGNGADGVGERKSVQGKKKVRQGSLAKQQQQQRPESVFYNNVQVFNRDSSTLAIRQFIELLKSEGCKFGNQPPSETSTDPAASSASSGTTSAKQSSTCGLKILEALSASGLRSIRYWHEIPNVSQIIANDLSSDATKDIARNVAHNQCENGVLVSHADANDLMYENRTTSLSEGRNAAPKAGRAKSLQEPGYDVIDLDPYGTAAPFIDAAVQSIRVGGLLCVTCTDLAVLAGNNPGTCYAKYGAVPTRGKYCHEMALRMVLQTMQVSAQRYKRYIVPLYSIHVDFYVRLFVRVLESPSVVKVQYKKMGYLAQCSHCPAFTIQSMGRSSSKGSNQPAVINMPQHCVQCGGSQKIGGPLWLDPIQDQTFIQKMLDHLQRNSDKFATHKRMEGFMTVAAAELADAPLFYNVPALSKAFKVATPSKFVFRSALINAGYNISKTHTDANAVKTNAPQQVIFDIMRAFADKNRSKKKPLQEGTLPYELTKRRGDTKNIDFTIHEASRQLDTVPVYFPNPEKFWGPKARAPAGLKRAREENGEVKEPETKKARVEAAGAEDNE
mmetsp:Transcript_1658/g.5783  ORF Transcript_1658/g.5783 Transcript_1658/m.5783 type:complete len:636 (+) Transcript_1658:36-1943(+)